MEEDYPRTLLELERRFSTEQLRLNHKRKNCFDCFRRENPGLLMETWERLL
jgi:hypothetical protein